MRLHRITCAALLALSGPLYGLAIAQASTAAVPGPAAPEQASASPAWSLAPDGSHVVQLRSRLVWPRCVEGMHWNGRSCAGTPLWVDHAQALEHARRRSQAEGVGWRLPSARELQVMSQLNMHTVRTENRALLPEPTLGWCWSGTTSVIRQQANLYNYGDIVRGPGGNGGQHLDMQHGWAVNTGTAEMRSDILRRTPMMLRLVRAADRPD